MQLPDGDEARALLRRWEEEAGKAAPPAYRIHAATLAALGDTDAAMTGNGYIVSGAFPTRR